MPLGRPVEPDEYIQNAMSSRCVSAASSAGAGCDSHSAADRAGTAGADGCVAIDDDKSFELRVPAGGGIEPVGEGGIGDGNAGAGVGQIELQQVGRRERVDEQRHEPGAHGPEQGGGIGRRIVEEQEHAVAALGAQRQACRAEAAGIGGELGIGARSRRARHGRALAPARAEIVEQDGAGVVALGHEESDFARARRIAWHGIGDGCGVAHGVPPSGIVERHEFRRHRAQALVVDAARAADVAHGKIGGREPHVLGEALVPGCRHLRRGDQLFHDRPPGAS